PLTDKAPEGVDPFQQDRAARVVEEAESYLTAITEAGRRIGDRAISDRLDRFVAAARAMCRGVEEDPRDITAARKYLGVYLLGARDATRRFADLWTRSRDTQARAEFDALLDDLQTQFAERTRGLLSDDRTDLAVEIEVLRDRLKRDGAAAGIPRNHSGE